MNNGVAPFRYTDGEGMVNLTPLIPITARKNGPLLGDRDQRAQGDPALLGVGDLRTELLRPRAFVNPPDVSAVSADPAVLAPPDGRMHVPVAIGVSVADER
jgi:hypothetical protein